MWRLLVQWEDKRKNKIDEIKITLETTTQTTRQRKQKLFVIKVHLKTGAITVQGNGFPIFGLREFPAIKEFVNTCISRDKQSSANIQSQSVEESCPKVAVGTESVPQELDLPEDTDVKGQRMIYKALHRKFKIEKFELH
jgi:hypothetical protein